MFTIFHLYRNRPIPARTLKLIWQHIEYFANTTGGKWLQDINWRGMEYRFADLMQDSGVGGAQTVVKANTIYLCDMEYDAPERHRQTWELFQLYPTIIHELRHVWQMRKWGWRYIICCLPILRNYTIEKDAYRIQDAAEKFFLELDGVRCAAQFRERNQAKEDNHD